MITKDQLVSLLENLDACRESIKWLMDFDGSPQEAWEQCERGDWMLWLLAKLEVDRKQIVLDACQCARLSLEYVPQNEDRPRVAIETAEAWTRGEVNLDYLDRAAGAAGAAARDGTLRKCADITREYFTYNDVVKLAIETVVIA